MAVARQCDQCSAFNVGSRSAYTVRGSLVGLSPRTGNEFDFCSAECLRDAVQAHIRRIEDLRRANPIDPVVLRDKVGL